MREIVRATAIVPLPRAPAVVEGVINVRGSVLPVLDIRQRFRLPVKVHTAAPELPEPVDTRRKRLLVVDDVVTTRSLIKSLLEAEGYEVRVAADGADAWRALHEHGADVVVTDIEMPRVDGFELTRQIRTSERFRDLPVVLDDIVRVLDHLARRRKGAP